jgi:hypothetical protein
MRIFHMEIPPPLPPPQPLEGGEADAGEVVAAGAAGAALCIIPVHASKSLAASLVYACSGPKEA